MANITRQLTGLEIGKTALYDFVVKKCRISLKRAHFYSKDIFLRKLMRNSNG
jgi:hypothetical protein